MTSKKFLVFVFWTVTTSIATCIAALTGIPGNLTKPGDSVTLVCQSDDPNAQVQFFRKDVNLADDRTGKYFIINNNNNVNKTLTVNKVGEQDLGEYICRAQLAEPVSISLYSKPVISPINTPSNLIEGETLQLACSAWGLPAPISCTWLKDGRVLTPSDPGVSFSDLMTSPNTSVANGRLTIAGMKRSDQTNYVCSASTADGFGQTNLTAYVRVKDRLAAVWPSIGIVIVIILTIIIIIFAERRRRKNEAKMHPQ